MFLFVKTAVLCILKGGKMVFLSSWVSKTTSIHFFQTVVVQLFEENIFPSYVIELIPVLNLHSQIRQNALNLAFFFSPASYEISDLMLHESFLRYYFVFPMGVTHLETKWYKMCSQLQMYDQNIYLFISDLSVRTDTVPIHRLEAATWHTSVKEEEQKGFYYRLETEKLELHWSVWRLHLKAITHDHIRNH